jgi:hypothetical protein
VGWNARIEGLFVDENELCLRHLESSVQPRSNATALHGDEAIILDTGVATTASRIKINSYSSTNKKKDKQIKDLLSNIAKS